MGFLILLFVSVLPIFLLGLFIYIKDKNREPFKLLLSLFLCGILSCFMVLLLSYLLRLLFPIFGEDAADLNLFGLIIKVFIGIALVEEFCKWFMSYFISFNHRNFDEIFDMVVYCVFVSLGFACFENILYVFQNGIVTGIMRAILAVPGHACYGVFMGYYLGLAKLNSINGRNDLKIKNIILSIVIPTVLHGIYDYCLFSGYLLFLLVFLVFVILLYIFTIRKIGRVSSVKRKLKYEYKYCPMCGYSVVGNYCPICGNKHKK